MVARWLPVVSKILALTLAVSAVEQIRPRIRLLSSAPTGNLIQLADLSCAGLFLSPQLETGQFSVGMPTTLKEFNGSKRVYLTYDGVGHLREYTEPNLSPCNTAIGSINVATAPGWGGDWGTFPVNAENDYIPGQNTAYGLGLHRDTVTGRVYLSWASNYSDGPQTNHFAARTLNEGDHTTTNVGCWMVPAYSTRWLGTGVLEIPSGFVSAHLPSGQRLGVGFGGVVASNNNSLGPALVSVESPAPNDCAVGEEYEITDSTLLEAHAENSNGPNCMSSTANGPGCTPALAPTAPYHAKTAFAAYSMDMYGWTWDPYDGHGWWTYEMAPRIGWYDDGVKQGVFIPFTMPSGWLNTTVSSATTPTYDAGTGIGTFTASAIDMHDGSNLNPGDAFWVQTCTTAIDGANCETTNGKKLTIAIATAVNPSTNLVTYQQFGLDHGNGTSGYKPIVGGPVWAGCIYAHGGPGCSRYTVRMQIYDPAQYAEVINSTRQPYNVQYVEEADGTTLFDRYGSPQSGEGVRGSIAAGTSYSRSGPSAVIPDPDRHQIVVFWPGATVLPGVQQHLAYVLDVSQALPSPVPAQASLPLVPLGLGALVSWRLGSRRAR